MKKKILIALVLTLGLSVEFTKADFFFGDQSYSEVIITIAGHEHHYQPQPDLGYVVLAQDDSDAIVSVYRDLNLFTQNEIIAIGGRDRQGLWIVENKQSSAQNEGVIKTLSAQRQIQYVAPLFSCNGETEAIIPEIVVRVTAGTEQAELEQICQMLNLRIKRRMMFTEQEYLVDVLGENADTVLAALIELNKIESIEWAAPNVITQRKRSELPVSENNSQGDVYLFNAPQNFSTTGLIPNDEYFPYQWHLHNTGQFGGTPDADINAPEAWEITAGDPNIVVVVHDTGVDLNHPDLVNNLVPGYDFYDDDDWPDPDRNTPLEAHGTTCAGMIAAEGNNDIGVVGVAWKCKLMPIRDGTSSSIITWAEEAEAVRWSAAKGGDVMSYSWGTYSSQPILDSAIVDITKPGGIGRDGKGCVVLAVAGNDGMRRLKYPAANPNVICVGATDYNDARWSYSNYSHTLDIVAPSGCFSNLAKSPESAGVSCGRDIPLWTTDISGKGGMDVRNDDPKILDYVQWQWGTSISCPIAAGVAALILSIEPNLTSKEVGHFLCRSAKDLGDPGRDDYYGWGRVDARAALDMVLAKRCDLNNDWKVDELDLVILNAAIETNDLSADIAPPAKRDDIVDEQDLELLMQYLGTEIPEMGLIAYWKLDETQGDIAYNSVADCNGTLIGGPVWQPDGGMEAGALKFDGIDDYISTDPVMNPADGEFSIFAWIKGGAPGQVVVSQQGSANWLMADTQGNLITELKSTGRSTGFLLSQTIITDGQWHRIGFVWDGTKRILYVDDVVVAEDTQINLQSSNGGLYIGTGKMMQPGTYFSGLIDDVRIYNRAVSP